MPDDLIASSRLEHSHLVASGSYRPEGVAAGVRTWQHLYQLVGEA